MIYLYPIQILHEPVFFHSLFPPIHFKVIDVMASYYLINRTQQGFVPPIQNVYFLFITLLVLGKNISNLSCMTILNNWMMLHAIFNNISNYIMGVSFITCL